MANYLYLFRGGAMRTMSPQQLQESMGKWTTWIAELAKKESDDVESGKNGGDLGAFSKGQMVPEFEQAAFAAKPGDITPVVKTQFGYHIIRLDDIQILVETAEQKGFPRRLARATPLSPIRSTGDCPTGHSARERPPDY